MEGINGFLATHRSDQHFSLLALGRVIEHYKRELPHLTVPMSVIKQPPRAWSWAGIVVEELKNQRYTAASLARDGIITDKIYPSPLTRQQAFVSILQFESGTLSADVDEMDKVMAISSRNSLFIAQRILSDPISTRKHSLMRCGTRCWKRGKTRYCFIICTGAAARQGA